MKKFVEMSVTRILERLGYVITPSWRFDDLALEIRLREIFDHYGITCVLDIGANAGQYRNFLRDRVRYAGLIHSFEPLPHLAAQLAEQARSDPNWHVHNYALGSENADKLLNVMAKETFSSFREPDHSAHPAVASSNTVTKIIRVPVRRLDDVASTLIGVADDKIYVKVDTQGFDLEVLNGAPSLLSRAKGLQFELAVQRIYKGVPHYLEMLKFVDALGYDISGFFPVSSEGLRAMEFDCVMVRRLDIMAAFCNAGGPSPAT